MSTQLAIAIALAAGVFVLVQVKLSREELAERELSVRESENTEVRSKFQKRHEAMGTG